MEKFQVPTMADLLLSSIATFHMTKIIVSDPSKFMFIGSGPESMYICVSSEIKLMKEYKRLPPTGPRQLTPEMQSSLDAANKPAKLGNKFERKGEKEGQSSKVSTPKKRKSEQVAPLAPKKCKTKKKAHKSKAPSSNDSDYVPSDQQPEPESSDEEVSQHESPLRGNLHPPSPAHEGNRSSPHPSTIQSVPITIAPCPPPISSSTKTSIPISTPLFTELTTTTATTEPQVRVNISYTGAPTSGTEPLITSKPQSPPPSPQSDIVLGGAEMEFDSVYFSPYRVQSDDDDDAPVTKRYLKDLNDKLDQLLSSSSSTPSEAYSEVAIKALLATFVMAHDSSITNAVNVVEASTSSCQKASIAVEASTNDCKQATEKKNSQMVNASADNLTSSLQAEKKHFEEARQSIKSDYTQLQSYVHTRLDELQADLAMENKFMDELALETTKVKTQALKHTQALKKNDELRSERAVIKISVGDVHSILLNLLEAHYSVLTISVRHYLAEKLRPALDILSRIEGVPETVVHPK
ncbi:hypothetical protein Lser_V15G06525 [Lactuca serriola]